jgi:hypothetical protein
LAFKANSGYDFIENNCFSKQKYFGEKVFIFNMSMDGDNSGCELVKQMQLGGDLQITWIMFDHVKCFQGWKTLACHVYDHVYYKVMTIAISTYIISLGGRPFHPSILSSVTPSIQGKERGPFLNCKTPLFQGIAHSALFIAQ